MHDADHTIQRGTSSNHSLPRVLSCLFSDYAHEQRFQGPMMMKASRATAWRLVRKRGPFWYASALFALYASVLLAHRAPPSLTDYADWTYEGILLRYRFLHLPDSAHLLKHYPVPNSAATIGIALLALCFSWQIAAKLWLCILFGTALFASSHMMRTRKGESCLWLLAPSAIFLNVNLWYGFVNFLLGLCWVILIGSLLLREERREWLFGLLLLLAFFCHMIPFGFAALLVILYVAQSGRTRLLWQLLPGTLLSIWYLLGRFVVANNADGNAGMVSQVKTYSAAFWAYKVNSYLKSLGFINPASMDGSAGAKVLGPSIFLAMQVLNVVLCAAVAWCLVAAATAAYREQKQERFVWTASLILLPLYLLAPGTALGISDPGSRLLQVALGILLFLCGRGSSTSQRLMRVAAGCQTGLQLAALLLFVSVGFAPADEIRTIKHLPQRALVFAHVPNHGEDFYYRALERSDMRLKIFPTAMFLNTPQAELDPAQQKQLLIKMKELP